MRTSKDVLNFNDMQALIQILEDLVTSVPSLSDVGSTYRMCSFWLFLYYQGLSPLELVVNSWTCCLFTCCVFRKILLQKEGYSLGRVLALLGFGFFKGCLISPLIQYAIFVDSNLILKALLCTSAIFISFSGAALLSKRRSFLFLGGILSSALLILCILSFFRLMFGMGMNNFELGVGLLIFCGYVIYDTQLIVEKSESGDQDIFKHTIELFTDFAAIFVRILIILTKDQDKKKD